MATLNFPSDTSQSPYEENGYTYEWDGEKWNITGAPSGGGGGSDYVLPTATDVRLGGIKVGNNLTIDGSGVLSADAAGGVSTLQQVTDAGNTTTNSIGINDEITLSSDGQGQFSTSVVTPRTGNQNTLIYFAGDAGIPAGMSGTSSYIYNGSSQDNDGTYFANTPFATAADLTALMGNDGSFRLGGALPASPNISLNADGTAEFAGTIKSTTWPTTGYELASSGALSLNAAGGTSGNMLVLKSGSTTAASITGTGSAEFAASVTTSGTNGFISAYRETTTAGNGLLDAHSDIGGTKTKKFVVRADGVVDIGGDIDSSPNIHLDGSDGSVSFVGGVTPGYIHIDDSPFYADDNQLFRIQQDGTNKAIIFGDGSTYFAGGQLEIDNRGTITRPGTAGLGGDYYSLGVFNDSGATNGAVGGRLVLKTDASGLIDTETIVLNGQTGSASFAAKVTSDIAFQAENTFYNATFISKNRTTDKDTAWTTGNGSFFLGTDIQSGINSSVLPTGYTISLDGSDGSATFDGSIQVGDRDFNSNTTYGCLIHKQDLTNSQHGGFYAQCNGANTNASSNFSLFEGRDGSTVTFDVRADGSASFSSTVSIASTADTALRIGEATVGYKGGWDNSGNLYLGSNLFDSAESKTVAINADGSAELGVNGSVNGRLNLRPNGTDTSLEVSSGSANGNIWTLSNNGTIVANSSANATNSPNYKLDATDGSASFAGNVIVSAGTGSSVLGADGGASFTNKVFMGSELSGTADVLEVSTQEGSGRVTIKADGSADFAGAVTAATVNGVNVANVGAALTSLKTAAASATDLDELKAAIASALTNF